MKKEEIGYLGPAGTFCEMAAEMIFPGKVLQPYPDQLSVIEAIASDDLTTGILPMENLLEGTVIPVLDGLTNHPEVKICGEYLLPVEHHLLGQKGLSPKEITGILSHSHALAQCQQFIKKQYPQLPCYPVTSTGEAARRVALELNTCAAIGNRRAAQIYDLDILAENIGDAPNNYTRFVVLSKKEAPPTGNDKTSLAFSLEHKSGSLAATLNLFAQAGLNLTKIESRPSRKVMGEYIFYLDFEGHIQDTKVKEVLNQAKTMITHLNIMGSYPKYCLK